ncbi:hypothetical protein [Patiriisocius marinus]|nr:hypothetical protein [Patiriisocius marinus]
MRNGRNNHCFDDDDDDEDINLTSNINQQWISPPFAVFITTL